MKNNPFTSDTFTAIWLKHFSKLGRSINFDLFPDLGFVQYKKLPLYINVGKTLTKGIYYNLACDITAKGRNKVFLIYDVPTYFSIVGPTVGPLKLIKSKQYLGFSIEMEKYRDFNDYMSTNYSRNSRSKLNKYKKKLEQSFDIKYKMFYGEISKNEYDGIFEDFKNLLEKRFLDKQITNNNLNPHEWAFYHEVAYPMILEKKASLFVIYDGEKPIGITLNYFSDTFLFDAITVFDIDYAKFRLGSVTVMKLIEYCFEQKIKVFDFSKGEFDYKKRWANTEYNFEYHLYYDSSSLTSRTFAFAIKLFYDLKQVLREKKLNERFHRITFGLRHASFKKEVGLPYEFTEIDKDYVPQHLIEVDRNAVENHFLKNIAFDFVYLNNEFYNDLRIYKIDADDNMFLFSGKTNSVKVKLSKPAI